MLNNKVARPSILPKNSFLIRSSANYILKPKVYVDKTELIASLIKEESFVCLCRPRRFGKTLTISLIADIFANGTVNFQDCAIAKDNLWQDETYPVLFFSFGDFYKTNTEDFNQAFIHLVKESILNTGAVITEDVASPSLLLRDFFKQTTKPVVVLVDEYDLPLLNSLEDTELYKHVESTLATFYSVFKIYEHKIRFMLLTGVNHISNLSIFSGFNNIQDISFDPAYASIVGYTEQELIEYFYEPLAKLANYYDLSFADFMTKLKLRYNGFCFDRTLNVRVFNTWDINQLLTTTFDSWTFLPKFWAHTGSLSNFIFKYFAFNKVEYIRFLNQALTKFPVLSFDEIQKPQSFLNTPPYLFMLHAGYLTLSSAEINNTSAYDEVSYYLDFPNQTIKDFVLNDLIYALKSQDIHWSKSLQFEQDYFNLILNPLTSADVRKETLTQMIVSAGVAPADCFSQESQLRTLLILIFKLAGFAVQFEVSKVNGRVDLMIIYENKGFIIELKVFRSSELVAEVPPRKKNVTEQVIKQASAKKKLEVFKQISKKEYNYVFPSSCQERYYGALVGDCSTSKITDFEFMNEHELAEFIKTLTS